MTIHLNGIDCIPLKIDDKIKKQEINIPIGFDGVITGWVGLLPTRSASSCEFHLYHNNRMIRASDLFGLTNNPAMMIVTGEVYLEQLIKYFLQIHINYLI